MVVLSREISALTLARSTLNGSALTADNNHIAADIYKYRSRTLIDVNHVRQLW